MSGPGAGQEEERIAFVGGGRMALALTEGFVAAGLLRTEQITVCDPVEAARRHLSDRLPGICFAETAVAAARSAAVVWLAVKPQQAAAAGGQLAAAMADRTLVSIVAGLSIASLAALTGTPRVIRVMPNTPCLVRRGVSVTCRSAAVEPAVAARVHALLESVGHVHEADESQLDAVTGLSGSGPGFLALVVEALADGGTQAGLPASLALRLAVQTLAGTGLLLEETGEHPAAVRERVASPGGTTLAGLAVLTERGVPAAVAAAVTAAAARARELGR